MKKQIRLLCIATALLISLQSFSVFAKNPEKVKNDAPDAKQMQEKEERKKNNEEDAYPEDEENTDEDLYEDADDGKDRKKDNHNKKFTKEELETRKKEYREKRLETKEYFAEIKINFGKSDAETKKLILAEIAELKEALKDYSIGVFVRGIEIDFEKYNNVKPRIENNRTLVPIRAVTESLGAEVEWDEETQTITISKGENIVVLQIGSTTVTVNGTEQECEVAPKIEKDRTLVPLRIISEALKENVEWDENSKTVIIEEN